MGQKLCLSSNKKPQKVLSFTSFTDINYIKRDALCYNWQSIYLHMICCLCLAVRVHHHTPRCFIDTDDDIKRGSGMLRAVVNLFVRRCCFCSSVTADDQYNTNWHRSCEITLRHRATSERLWVAAVNPPQVTCEVKKYWHISHIIIKWFSQWIKH